MIFERTELNKGFSLYCLPTKKFKATTISLFIHRPLDQSATRNTLLLKTLARGCKQYPNMRKIVIFLESLYGASFTTGVGKLGERHILQFHVEIVNERFLPHTQTKTKNTQKILDFLKRIISEPIVAHNGLRQDYFKEERTNLKHLIEGLIDDKMAYAKQRCIEEMCRNEPFGLYEYGKIADLDKITPRNLLTHLQEILLTSPMDIYVVGDINPSKLANGISKSFTRLFSLRRKHIKHGGAFTPIPPTQINISAPAEPRIIKEKLPVDQTKLVMGFRTGINWQSETIFSMIVFNTLLGGYSNSRLFLEVREKAGLAYYVSSQLDSSKGLILLHAGINHEQFSKTVDIIQKQIAEIGQGNISKEEFNNTLKTLQEQLTMMEDNPNSLITYFAELFVHGRSASLENLRDKLLQITPEQVAAVARQIKLDTIYCLSAKT